MHILYIPQHFSTPQGATGTRPYEMASRLVHAGHEVTVICGSLLEGTTGLSGKPIRGVRKGVVNGIQIIEIAMPYGNKHGFLRRALTFVRFSTRATWMALTMKYDLLFTTTTPLTSGIPGIVMKLLRRSKTFVFEVRDLWPELPKAMGVIKNPLVLLALDLLEFLSYRSADRLVALSPGIKEGICRRGVPEDRVALIPNASDLDLFQPDCHKGLDINGIEPGDFTAVFTGAHGMANGLEAVLDAAAELKKRGRQNIKLVFIGQGMRKPALRERAEAEGLDNCIFLDPVPKVELARLLPKANLGMMILANVPAFYRGTSPNKFFDYISAGLPVINNYPGWLAEMIESHDCGVVVPPGDAAAFADALERLAADPEVCRRYGANARALAEREFSRDTLGNRMIAFLAGREPEMAGCRPAANTDHS
ncbi:Glycosyltransferase family 4 protein [Sulfidibacter corallicola]|uniref:Glycosyltransferase family 4 protein n=1 Tax=Sulfidibacter corallicola TaxID=2818388 RepID=A0A8A4TUA6_SULCO|nr:glycosyltransferase family 4 protein [Sulfidibacter corallicola]QTD52708.1 glycosyltransferase family 4 protein [Sulfidibacter corallicola]